jgi:hypothetical protein
LVLSSRVGGYRRLMDCISPACDGTVNDDFRCDTCDLEQVVTHADEIRVPSRLVVELPSGQEIHGLFAETVNRTKLTVTTKDREAVQVGLDEIRRIGHPEPNEVPSG